MGEGRAQQCSGVADGWWHATTVAGHGQEMEDVFNGKRETYNFLNFLHVNVLNMSSSTNSSQFSPDL